MTKALSALLLSDGRPGHFNLAEGILAAAQRLRPVEITRIEVRRGRWPGYVLATWSNGAWSPARLLRVVYGLDPALLPKLDLVVSAGAETLAANVACARLTGAANVFYGSLRRFHPESFDLVLTSFPRLAGMPRHALALKSSPAAGLAWAARSGSRRLPPKRLALLVGGESGETTYTEGDWDRLLALVASAGAGGIRWLISNSRRTPSHVSDRFAAMAASGTAAIDSFTDVRARQPTSLLTVLANADAAVVTDDSSSMVSDAVTAGLATVGLSPAQHQLQANEQDYRDHLTASGWYRSLPIDGLTPEQLSAQLAALTPRTEDTSATTAALLAARLPSLFRSKP